MANGFTRFLGERFIHFKKMVPLSITFFFYLFGWGLLAPIFNIRINEITGSLFLSGIVFSMVGFVRIFLDPSVGLLCDKFSPKKLLQIALLSYALIFFLYSVVNSFIELLIIRVFNGFAAALLWICGWTLVRRKSKGRYAQEELSAWVTIQDIAYIFGPIIGGFLITALSWKPVFYIASLISLIAFVYASISLENPELKHKPISLKKQFKSFFKNKSSSIRLVSITLLIALVASAFAGFLPLRLDASGVSIEEISIILSIAVITPYLIFPVIIGVLSDRYGRKIPTIIGLLCCFYGLFMFSNLNSFAQFFFYTFVIYTGFAFISMSVNAELNDLLHIEEVGGFTGIFEMIKDVGNSFGPIIFGLIASFSGMGLAFMILSLISISSIVVLKGFKDF